MCRLLSDEQGCGQRVFTERPPQTAPQYARRTWRLGVALIVRSSVRDYVENWKLQAMIVRPFDHTGPGQSELCPYSQFVSGIAAGVVSGNPVFLEAGDLKPLRDVSDVRDVISAYVLVAERGKPGEIWNVCSGKGISLAEIVRELAEMGGVDVTIKGDAPSPWHQDPLCGIGDASRIFRDLGWKAEIPVRTTLRDLLEYWIRRHQTLRK